MQGDVLVEPLKKRDSVTNQNGHDRIAHFVGESEAQAFSGYFTTADKPDAGEVRLQSLAHQALEIARVELDGVPGLPQRATSEDEGRLVVKLNICLDIVKSAMSPRRRKAEDADVFAALVRVMQRRGPAELTLREIAREAGVTAGALVQRFGSKRAMVLAHARHAAATGDVGLTVPGPRTSSPLEALRSVTAMYAQLADSPRAAVRNLAYLLNDLADPALRRHLLRLSRAARIWYEEVLTDAVAARELRADADVRALARLIEVTLRGSFLNWTLYRDGSAAVWLREDLDDMLRPHLMRGDNRRRRNI